MPALARHADRERALALNYLTQWSPPCTRELWSQCIHVLDALNAAVFELVCMKMPFRLLLRSLRTAAFASEPWEEFCEAVDDPPWLSAPPDAVRRTATSPALG